MPRPITIWAWPWPGRAGRARQLHITKKPWPANPIIPRPTTTWAALAGRGRIDEAIGHYEQAVKLRPDYAEAHYNLGLVLAGRGRIDEAAAQFQAVLNTRPDHPEAHNNLGVLLAGQGHVDEAIAHFRKAVKTQARLRRGLQESRFGAGRPREDRRSKGAVAEGAGFG